MHRMAISCENSSKLFERRKKLWIIWNDVDVMLAARPKTWTRNWAKWLQIARIWWRKRKIFTIFRRRFGRWTQASCTRKLPYTISRGPPQKLGWGSNLVALSNAVRKARSGVSFPIFFYPFFTPFFYISQLRLQANLENWPFPWVNLIFNESRHFKCLW